MFEDLASAASEAVASAPKIAGSLGTPRRPPPLKLVPTNHETSVLARLIGDAKDELRRLQKDRDALRRTLEMEWELRDETAWQHAIHAKDHFVEAISCLLATCASLGLHGLFARARRSGGSWQRAAKKQRAAKPDYWSMRDRTDVSILAGAEADVGGVHIRRQRSGGGAADVGAQRQRRETHVVEDAAEAEARKRFL